MSLLDFVAADIVELDGMLVAALPTRVPQQALADLERETGMRLLASFEHEFQIFGIDRPPAPSFSLSALRRADPFGPALMEAHFAAGLAPENFIAEYGRDQYEVTIAPADGLTAADRAMALREIVREIASITGWRATFAPKTAVSGVGNGVHIHFSRQRGRPAGD